MARKTIEEEAKTALHKQMEKLPHAVYNILHHHLGISSHRLTKIKENPQIVTAGELPKLAAALNIPMDCLLEIIFKS